MCNLGEAVAAMGEEKRQLANLKSLMETLGFTAEQAMDALEVPEDERRRYADML